MYPAANFVSKTISNEEELLFFSCPSWTLYFFTTCPYDAMTISKSIDTLAIVPSNATSDLNLQKEVYKRSNIVPRTPILGWKEISWRQRWFRHPPDFSMRDGYRRYPKTKELASSAEALQFSGLYQCQTQQKLEVCKVCWLLRMKKKL